MASGDVHVSAKFVSNMTKTALAALWASDVVKMGIITNAQTPNITDSDPRWGAGGTQNYSTAEVTPGGSYSAGGISRAVTTSTLSGAVTSLNATSPIALAANAANPTGEFWGIFYDSTRAGKEVFGSIDLASSLSLVRGHSININGVSLGPQPLLAGTAN